MDLFNYLSNFRVLVCVPCGSGVPPAHLGTHLRTHHADHAEIQALKGWPGRGVKKIVEQILNSYSILDPRNVAIEMPPPESPPVPGLRLYHGIQCSHCPYIRCGQKSKEKSMQNHSNLHRAIQRRRGGQPRVPQDAEDDIDAAPLWQEITCQRFFATGHQSSFFRVTTATPEVQGDQRPAPRLQKDELLRALIDKELDGSKRELEESAKVYLNRTTKTEVSPWLEMTRWPRYFNGLKLAEVAPLGYTANPATEPALQLLIESLDRVVEQAHLSIREDRIGVFDQAKINSFITGNLGRPERMLMIKLQKSTYREYKGLWKRLLCFAYRTSQPNQRTQLAHQFTTSQLACLDSTVRLAEALRSVVNQGETSPQGRRGNAVEEIQADLDKACLLLCVSLLDHNLRGSHFDSVVIGFLAVLGIDERKEGGVFLDPLAYSPFLSKFIKIAQMIVLQRAVVAAEEGEVEYASDMVDDMRERFMVRGSRSAFDWACRLRAFAKTYLNSTTSLGYIIWSEDKETVEYKTLKLRMADFREFVARQVRLAQDQLEELLLLHPSECREDVIPALHIHRLRDDHSSNKKGWNFLQDPRNLDQLQGGGRWLLDRVLANDWLKEEFVYLTNEGQVRWKKAAVKLYVSKVEAFLERLLLLIHLTSGQPARGTELVSLRHVNTAQGHHRNIFIEDGVVGTVTTYHKGYNVTGSTKIIHRYLPREVSELLIYYLWLILPFWEKMEILVYKRKDPPSPFLWAKGGDSWDSCRLRTV